MGESVSRVPLAEKLALKALETYKLSEDPEKAGAEVATLYRSILVGLPDHTAWVDSSEGWMKELETRRARAAAQTK